MIPVGVFLLFAAAHTALAATNPIETTNNQATINVGYLPTQINNSPIEENSQYLKGHQLGLGMSLTKMFYHRIYAQAALNTTAGNLSYGHHTTRTTATSFVQNGSLRLGYLFLPQENIGFTPYATLGYQFWQLEVGGHYEKGLIKNGFTKFYQNGFYGLGLLSQIVINPRLVASLDMTVGKTINPWTHYNAPDLPNAVVGKNIIYQSAFLRPQPFYQVGVGADYAINDQLHANAGVQYNHAEISGAGTNPSKLVSPHLSIAEWNYHAGIGLSLDPPCNSTQHYDNTASDAILRANNLASLSLGYVCQSYGETTPGLDYYFDRQVGNIPAAALAINKTIANIYTQFNLAFAGGITKYLSSTGTTNASSPPSNDHTRNSLFDASLRLGYMVFPTEKIGITPYVAGGYHRWLRDLPGVGDEGFLLNGYPETYQFSWYALGVLAQVSPTPNWVLNLDVNAGTMENVTNKSWSPFNSPPTFQKLLTLKQRFAYNFGVGGDYRFARDWHALAQVNYWYFKYGRSANSYFNINSYVYEPNSTTRQLSIMVGIGYELS